MAKCRQLQVQFFDICIKESSNLFKNYIFDKWNLGSIWKGGKETFFFIPIVVCESGTV